MVKDKPNSIRTYDQDGFRKRAACLCVKNELEDEVNISSLYQPLMHSTSSLTEYKNVLNI